MTKKQKARLFWIVERNSKSGAPARWSWWVRPNERTIKLLAQTNDQDVAGPVWYPPHAGSAVGTQAEALNKARSVATLYWERHRLPSEIRIRRVRDGQFRDPITIPRSSDPRKTKG